MPQKKGAFRCQLICTDGSYRVLGASDESYLCGGDELIVVIYFGNSWHARETYQFAKDVAAFPPSASIRHHRTGRLWQL